jgi:ankyrin repeat protein
MKYQYLKMSKEFSYFRLLDDKREELEKLKLEEEKYKGKFYLEKIDSISVHKRAVTEILDFIIDSKLLDLVIDEWEEDSETILISAVHSCNLEYVKILVEKGNDVNLVSDGNCDFALKIADQIGWQEGFDYLYPLTDPELRNLISH